MRRTLSAQQQCQTFALGLSTDAASVVCCLLSRAGVKQLGTATAAQALPMRRRALTGSWAALSPDGDACRPTLPLREGDPLFKGGPAGRGCLAGRRRVNRVQRQRTPQRLHQGRVRCAGGESRECCIHGATLPLGEPRLPDPDEALSAAPQMMAAAAISLSGRKQVPCNGMYGSGMIPCIHARSFGHRLSTKLGGLWSPHRCEQDLIPTSQMRYSQRSFSH